MSNIKSSFCELLDQVRSLLALKILDLASDVAPMSEKSIYIKGSQQIITKIVQSDFSRPEEASGISYYPKRFWAICVELELDPHKVLDSKNPLIISIISGFVKKEIDEVQVMRSLRNLSILNRGEWKV